MVVATYRSTGKLIINFFVNQTSRMPMNSCNNKSKYVWCIRVLTVTYYYYSFPKNEEMRHKWLSSIHVKQKITKNSVVCSRHFEPSCFDTANSRQLLKADAFSTIFPVVRLFYYYKHSVVTDFFIFVYMHIHIF